MSLSDDQVLPVLQKKLVCGFKNIAGESYAGVSGKHERDDAAARTTNGAGPHNMQIFLLAPDGTVLHCLPGYWSPADLVREVEFASKLLEVWKAPGTRAAKDARFKELQLAHVDEHPRDMVRRSRMQGFDQKFEQKHRPDTSDCILPDGGFKTTDRILHERMATRPFVKYAQFDVAQFADYGRPKYDKHGIEGCEGQLGEKPRRERKSGPKPDRKSERREAREKQQVW